MDKAKRNKIIEKKMLENDLKQEFDQTLQDRIDRYLSVKPHEIISDTHFAGVSAECFLLYRDGHYYGCVALAQGVAEALIRLLCNANSWPPCNDYKENVKNLLKRNKITNEISISFLNIWKKRNDYHHLNVGIEKDRIKLQALAKEKLESLNNIEKWIFAYMTNEGKLVPKYPKYWNLKQGKTNVFLRID